NEGVDLHYVVNITGHGWRKLMRAPQPFAYVIKDLPPQQLIFDFLQKHGPVSDYEAYGNFNMGAGLALYVPPSNTDLVRRVAKANGYPLAYVAGHIESSSE